LSHALCGTTPREFTDALCREIVSFGGSSDIGSIFFGGGTPSLLNERDLDTIFSALRQRFTFRDPEISLEANPDDVTESLVQMWRDCGINRVSLGVQSFDDEVLRWLGRRHNAASARRACETVEAHFDNWATDLIFGAHPVSSWTATLDQCVSLNPKHVSCYGLTYETGTPFESRANQAVDDDTWLTLYRQAHATLTRSKTRTSEFRFGHLMASCPNQNSDLQSCYDHYEISNFAKPGYQCRHNLIYWHNEDYAGFGPGAYSYLNGVRARNHTTMDAYLAAPGAKLESLHLTEEEIRLETVIQHLRLKDGLSKHYYRQRFGRDVREDFATPLDVLIKRGLVEENTDIIRPTMAGFELNNEIGLALIG